MRSLLGKLLSQRIELRQLSAEVDLLRIAASQLVLHAVDLDCEFRCLRLVLLVRLGLFNEGLFHLDYRGIQRILLLLSGNDTRAARPASSGEGTACVDDLTVKRNDAESEIVFLTEERRRVDIVHDNGKPQQVADYVPVLLVAVHEVACYALEALL